MTDVQKLKKKDRVLTLLIETVGMSLEVDRFFDENSERKLDEKIAVLTALKNGKPSAEIPSFYDVLELYPNGMWD